MKQIFLFILINISILSVSLANEPLKNFYLSCEGQIDLDGMGNEKFFQDIKVEYHKNKDGGRFIGYEIKIIQSDAKINIYADRMLLEQVIFNLIGNAVKFSPEHKSIELICKLHGNNIGITVRDFGIGISSESIENVFNLFHRIEKKDSYTQGNGLGLAICKGIVEAHGGNIKAKSDGIDSGSKFIINLPRP